MYGNDANAAKAAGHEFKSSAAFFDLDLEDVQIPLMAIIDYRGFRVSATSLLPISGRDTLIYGSCDGGRTVEMSDPEFNALMERAATLLNLKPHLVGRENPKLLYMPVDVEGHVTLRFKTKSSSSHQVNDANSYSSTTIAYIAPTSATSATIASSNSSTEASNTSNTESQKQNSKRSYVVLDLARLFPPQMPLPTEKGSKHRPYLYELLRPEFVKTNPAPLSSDAFSPFNSADPRAKEHNDEVAAACHRLKTVRIPQFAAFLQKSPEFAKKSLNELTCQAFVASLHSHGINIRYLGFVRKCLSHLSLRQIALTEMVARVVKDQINHELRNTTETVQLPVEEPYRETIVNYLNKLFGAETADAFWKENIKWAVLTKFNLKTLELEYDKNRMLDGSNGNTSTTHSNDKDAKRDLKKLKMELKAMSESSETSLRHFIDPLVLWDRVSQLTGVTLRKDALRVMVGGLGLTSPDIKILKSRIRVTDLVNRAQAISISMEAKTKMGTEALRLYRRANELFLDCLETNAANAETYYHWGVMLQEMASHSYFNPKKTSLKLLKLGALPKLAQAVQLNPGHLDANAALGWSLLDFLLHHQRFEAVNAMTTNKEALKDTTKILERAAHHLVLSLGSVGGRSSEEASGSPYIPNPEVHNDTLNATPGTIASLTASGDSGSHQTHPNSSKSGLHDPLFVQAGSSRGLSVAGSSETQANNFAAISAATAAANSPSSSNNLSSPHTGLESSTGSSSSGASGSIPSLTQMGPSSTSSAKKKKDKDGQKDKEKHKNAHGHSHTLSHGQEKSEKLHSSSPHSSHHSHLQRTTDMLPKLRKKQIIENTVSLEEYTERFEELAEKIEFANASLFMALTYALWNNETLRALLSARGEWIGELDLVDASFLPKKGFILIPHVCPNLRVLRIRNAVFLDSKTAGEMLKAPNNSDSLDSVTAQPQNTSNSSVPSTPNQSRTNQSRPAPPIGTIGANSGSTAGVSLHKFPPIRFIKNKIAQAAANKQARASNRSQVTGTAASSSLPNLRVLRFVCCEHLTDIEDFERIAFPGLEILAFEKTGLSDTFFANRLFAKNCPNLADLIICGSQLSDTSLNRIGIQFGNQLRSLELSACLNQQYVSCFNLMVNQPSLTSFKCITHLDMSGCRSLAAITMAQFVKSLSAPPAAPKQSLGASSSILPPNYPSSSQNSSSISLNQHSSNFGSKDLDRTSDSISSSSSGSKIGEIQSHDFANSSNPNPHISELGSSSASTSFLNPSSQSSSSSSIATSQSIANSAQGSQGSAIRSHQLSTPAPAPLPSSAPESVTSYSASASSVASLGISMATMTSVSKLPYTLNVPSLMFLNLDGCSSITEDVWNALPKKCPLLVSVSMEKASAKGTFLELLGTHCQRLERLHAPACKFLEPVSLMKILQGCPGLQYLDASFWVFPTTHEFSSKFAKTWTANNLPTSLALEQVYICAWQVDSAFANLLFSRCSNLKTIDFSNCHGIGPTVFSTFASHCLKLRKIIANNFSLTDESVDVLTSKCRELVHVSFLRATDLTDSALLSLSRCKKLQRLNITNSSFITNEGLQMIVTACPTLTRIVIRGSKLITSDFVFEKLRHTCAELNIEMDASKQVFFSFPL